MLAFYHSGIVPGVALILSVYMHSGAGLTKENWQLLSTIGQWLNSQALPFIIGGDFQVEPKQLEDSGWLRTVGGFVVAPHSQRSRRRIGSSISSLSPETSQALVKLPRISLSTLHLTGPSESLFPRG